MTTQTKTFTDRSNCVRAAKKELGASATNLVDYRICPVEMAGGAKGFRWEAIEAKPLPVIETNPGEFSTTIGMETAEPINEAPEGMPGFLVRQDGHEIGTGAHCAAARPKAPEQPNALFDTRADALGAARAALGKDAKIGEAFAIRQTARGEWYWSAPVCNVVHLKGDPDMATAKGKAPKNIKAPERMRASTKEAFDSASAGKLPSPPDFSAETHKRFRDKLAELIALTKAGDVAALRAFVINPVSSSRQAMDRYRNLAVIALEARAAKSQAA